MLRQNLQNLVTRFYKTLNNIEDYRDTLIKDREPLPQLPLIPAMTHLFQNGTCNHTPVPTRNTSKCQEIFFRSNTIPYYDRTPTATHPPIATIRDIERHEAHLVDEFFDIPKENMYQFIRERNITYTEDHNHQYPQRYFNIDFQQRGRPWATTFPE